MTKRCFVNILKADTLNFENWTHGKYSSRSAEISNLWDSKKLGFHIEELAPKSFSCPYHFHHQEEELFLALKGKAMVRQDGEFYEIVEGDLVLFKSGVAHQFYNHTLEPFRFLALSDKALDEVCEYPDSSKKWERKAKKLTQNGTEVEDYFLDEENPDLCWPKELL